MYGLTNVFPPSNFEVFNCCYFLCYWLQRAETCTNCINKQALLIFEHNWYIRLHLLRVKSCANGKNVNNEVTIRIRLFSTTLTRTTMLQLLLMIGFFSFSTLGTRDFFSRVTRSFVGRRPTRPPPSAEDTSGEAARNNFSRGSLFKTWQKPETAHEKSLAPRVQFLS